MPRDRLEQFNTKLPKTLRMQIKILAVSEGKKMHEVIRDALIEYLADHDPKGPPQ